MTVVCAACAESLVLDSRQSLILRKGASQLLPAAFADAAGASGPLCMTGMPAARLASSSGCDTARFANNEFAPMPCSVRTSRGLAYRAQHITR